jgi:hypothetical protein
MYVVSYHCSCSGKLDGTLGSLVEIVERNDLETGVLDQPGKKKWVLVELWGIKGRVHILLGLSLLGALKTDDKGNGQVKLLSGLDDTLGDVVTAHDTWDSSVSQPENI